MGALLSCSRRLRLLCGTRAGSSYYLVSAGLFAWIVAYRKQQSKRASAAQCVVFVVIFAGGVLGGLFPPVARMSREYYAGKDQFEWIKLLHSPDESTRNEALVALCEMLQSSRAFSTRNVILQSLGHCGKNAEAALPTLRQLLCDEDVAISWRAAEAIKEIEESVANTSSCPHDRLPCLSE